MALTGDYTPHRLRATMIMLTFTGAPLGGFLGGLVVSLCCAQGFGWPIIFIIGGVFPLVLIAISVAVAPEVAALARRKSEPRAAPSRAAAAPRHRARTGRGAWRSISLSGNPITMLFSEGYALQTMLLWIIFFCSLLNLFLFVFWLPEVLHLIGMTPAQAVFATSLYPLGGDLRGALPRMGDRPLWRAAVAGGALRRRDRVHRADLAVSRCPICALLVVVLLAGVTVLGSQTG